MPTDIIKQKLKVVNICGVLALLILIGATGFFMYSFYKDGIRHGAETTELRKDLANYADYDKSNTQIEADMKDAELRLAKVESRLPADPEQDKFVTEIAQVMQDAGVTVLERNTSTPYPVEGGYQALPVYLKGVGTWEACYKLLVGLRSMKRITRLDHLTIDVPPDSVRANPAEPLREITIDFSTFFREKANG